MSVTQFSSDLYSKCESTSADASSPKAQFSARFGPATTAFARLFEYNGYVQILWFYAMHFTTALMPIVSRWYQRAPIHLVLL